jgi:ABC-type antimicrobial peptide transport system permease subunit
MRRQGLEREPVAQIFEPLAQRSPRSVDIFIRTASDNPLTMAGALRAAVHRAEKHAPIYGLALLEDRLAASLRLRRFQTSLLTGFSIVALVMAAIGIYGLIQYSIATRTQEIGLRMAIGAQSGDIFRMIIGEGLTLSLIGVAVGLGGAWWLGRTVSSLLFGVTPTDPWTFITVSLLLTAVATVASYFPARRAMRVDPIVALRVT